MMNNLTIQGNLVNDVTMGTSQDGKKYCYGKIAVNQGKDKDGNDRDAMFFEFTAFGYDAETLSMTCKKGDAVILSGRLEEVSNTAQDGRLFINKKIVANVAKGVVKRPVATAQVDPFAQYQ